MTEASLSDLIGHQVLGVAGTYSGAAMQVYICGVFIESDTLLRLVLPNGHQFQTGQSVTVHLDNRTGVSEYDAELHVYRTSFKGKVTNHTPQQVMLEAVEYQVFYGPGIVKSFQTSDYQYPADARSTHALPVTPLQAAPGIDLDEHENKIGVLFTRAQNQPHSTVMAFLSTVEDDVFFITFKGTFKAQLLARDNQCYFAIDSRATFTFEHAIEWNYSIIQGTVYQVPKDLPLFKDVQEKFIAKNPWEMGFFSHPDVEMYHLKANHVICPTKQG